MGSRSTARSDPFHTETRLRVRYAETDQMGIVYYANYLIWMEIGRTDFCMASGFRYSEMEAQTGVGIAVAESHCRYRAPARYDDEVVIRTRLERLRRRTMRFTYEIRNAASWELLADGHTFHVAIDRHTGRPRALPESYRRLLEGRESPQPAI